MVPYLPTIRKASRWAQIGFDSAGPDLEWEIRFPRIQVMAARKPELSPLIDADVQSESFRETRRAHRMEIVEDYVELIDDLIAAHGEARQVDIAERLGVAQPTVAKMLKRLIEEGFVVQQPYRGVFLTALGKDLATESRERHRVVMAFLLALGISPETARRDAEGIEHHVSGETLDVFRAFTHRSSQA